MKNIEILAPVGGEEQLIAAVRSGADAVYFGAASFNARRNAVNFTDDDFIGAVRYCHERGVKAYITLNTLIKDSEEAEFEKTLKLIARSGADAVIVQDMGVFSRVRECVPTLPVHASTQMAVHNIAGARLLESLGFSRIVLARELSFEEIKEITEAVNTEIEVFVHGAHCMSASGMCYMSSFFGARSGNRGLCAQPCRLNFRSGEREYALSLKDMCLADETEKLAATGVTSFKIEGRMKRPEYVAAAVSAYKNAVNGITPDMSLLQSVFSRSGFTKGYFEGKRSLSMFGYRTKEDVLSASSGVLNTLSNTYRNENPLVEISMNFELRENEPCRLSISDGVNTVCAEGAVPERAQKTPLTAESAEKSLGKLGSTFYFCNNILCDIEDGLMLRASDINAVRREACERLTEVRGRVCEHTFIPRKRAFFAREISGEPDLYISLRSLSQLPDETDARLIILPVRELIANASSLGAMTGKMCVKIPALVYPSREERLLSDLKKLAENGIRYAYCDNIGAVEIAKKAGLSVIGGALLNITNSVSADAYYSLGAGSVTLSPELSSSSLKNIRTAARAGICIYGYMPLMHFRCCPLQKERGCGECKGSGVITDRMGESFTVLCEERQFSVLYNTVPLYLGDKRLPRTDFVLMSFSTENKYGVKKIIDAYKNKKAPDGRKTAGLFERELL
ncbi:MAG: U32 family peptidase [Clostridia bacterium]|nr:U32 family peptidase [Clostridia bacterium]